MSVKDISKIFSDNCNYNNINKNSDVKMRNIPKGVSLNAALSYRFLYTFLKTTKESITSRLNNRNKTELDRQAYDAKEKNLPLFVFSEILNNLNSFYNTHFVDKEQLTVVSTDGTYNRDDDYSESLNMVLFDNTNSIPIGLESFGKGGKNNEIKCFKAMIARDPSKFASSIIVADRAYFCYDFIKYLIKNNIKFVIRIKGDAVILADNINDCKNKPNYKNALFLRDKIRTVKCESVYEKTIFIRDPKTKSKRNVKRYKKSVLTVRNDCNLITNLLDDELYDDAHCLKLYRSRWDVETFIRFIKETYKFSKLTESNKTSNLKSYLCILSIEMIIRIIVKKYIKSQKITITDCKFNHSNLAKGIVDDLLIDLIYNNMSDSNFLHFCKSYITFNKIKNDRTYPRTSKMPFTKWYIKQYSIAAEFNKMINAIKNNCFDKLNKNLKTKLTKILKIDGVFCNTHIT